jgi:hypothetical protein
MKSASREFICKIQMKKLQEYSAPGLKAVWTESITDRVDLEAEYRRTRAALLSAGVDMTDNMDALYRDWRRWRDMPKTVTQANRPGVVAVDQWWARHLAQFRSLIDAPHVAARAERARKDQGAPTASRASNSLIDTALG